MMDHSTATIQTLPVNQYPYRPNANVYEYEPLLEGQIRTLLLLPGQGDDPREGWLEAIKLNDPPLYSAISYAWGEPAFPRAIELNHGHLMITESLHGASSVFARTKE